MTIQSIPDSRASTKPSFGLRSCVLVLLVVACLLYLFLRGLGAFLITGDRLEPSDVVVPLGGGGDHRVKEAVRLMQERYALWMIITEPGELEPGEGLGSQYFRITAIESGLSPHAILISEDIAKSTYDEARSVRKLMERHQYKSVIIVNDPFHTQRTRMIFRDVFRDSSITVRVHPVPNHPYRSGSWFFSLEGWGHTIREYVKMVGYLTGLYQSLE